MKTMTAKFAGACAECGAAIDAGDKIKWSKATGAICAGECYDAEAAAEAHYFGQIENAAEIRGFTEATAYDHGAGGGDPDEGWY